MKGQNMGRLKEKKMALFEVLLQSVKSRIALNGGTRGHPLQVPEPLKLASLNVNICSITIFFLQISTQSINRGIHNFQVIPAIFLAFFILSFNRLMTAEIRSVECNTG